MIKTNTVPLGVWYKTFILVLVLIVTTTLYDQHYKKNNPYINVVRERLNSLSSRTEKPLVVTIGASLEMLGTPKDWDNDEFQWLRVIIQGARLDDFEAVTQDVVNLHPDLVIIGLHQFIDKPYSLHLREAFKRLLRAPLQYTGLIRNRINQHEISRCSPSISTIEQAIDGVQKQFISPKNELLSASVLNKLLANNIPVVIVQTPMLIDIEKYASNRTVWLQAFYQDAATLGIEVLRSDLQLDESYFCQDRQHANQQGQNSISTWLKPQIIAALEKLK